MRNTFKSDIQLGERYRDEQTSLEGVATAIFFFQHACERVQLEYLNGDRELQEVVFDAPRLTHIRSGLAAVSERPGGPVRRGEGRRPGGSVR